MVRSEDHMIKPNKERCVGQNIALNVCSFIKNSKCEGNNESSEEIEEVKHDLRI